MNRAVLIAASSFALALAGCGKDPADSPADTTSGDPLATLGAVPATGAASVVSMSSPTRSGAQVFADAAAASDRFELEISKLAGSRAQSAQVRDFTKRMIEEHTTSTARLSAAASEAEGGITPAPRLSAMQQQALESLSAQSGAEFDAAYARVQVEAHRDALKLLQDYAASGSSEPLKAFAREMAPIVSRHLDQARALK